VVAATHIDLASAVQEGRFRGDLYARLRGSVIRVPSLRQRREDILLLASHFLSRVGAKLQFTPDAAEILLTYDWPFNVRELEQVCAHVASAVADGEKIGTEHLPEFLRPQLDGAAREIHEPTPVSQVMEGVLLGEGKSVLDVSTVRKPSASTLEQVLRFYGGNIAHVSAYFSKDRHQIYRWCRQYGLDPAAIREELKLSEAPFAGDEPRGK
jgi:DNA-binding NtrC family response regulator